MFVSHEKPVVKKKYQKPNILRKKAKPPPLKPNACDTHESHTKLSDSVSCVPEKSSQATSLENILKQNINGCPLSKKPFQVETPSKPDINCINRINENDTKQKPKVFSKYITNNLQNNNNEEDNIDSMKINLNQFGSSAHGETNSKNSLLLNIDTVSGKRPENNAEQSLNDISGSSQTNLEIFDISQLNSLDVGENLNAATFSPVTSEVVHVTNGKFFSTQNLSITFVPNDVEKFKCNVLACGKEFCSKQKLNKHKNRHNKALNKEPRQMYVECPVRQVHLNGTETPCGKAFVIREELSKHLNEDHTLEDAPHSCEECGRRFFWRSGLRAHSRAHCGLRTVHTCAWPGCGRVFRQPCRLREHTRVHTGDKPYPCRHPNCGWSFRTASKLMRHARRHTGERRHVCTACGHAFLRREHLRLHHQRFHQMHAHLCTHADCHETFSTANSLYHHMKKVHGEGENLTGGLVETAPPLVTDEEDMLMVGVDPTEINRNETVKIEETAEEAEEFMGIRRAAARAREMAEAEGLRAARTHCTWPLAPHPEPVYEVYDDEDNVYVLEEGVDVGQSEGYESNVYTVRSDLFLHGNTLTNEDSQNIGGESAVEEASVDRPDMGLLDSHPTIGLMQEELLYPDDAAVDESSFRVFLLTGDELT